MSNLDALAADIRRIERDLEDVKAAHGAATERATNPRAADLERRTARGEAEQLERRRRKLGGDLRMARARLREAEAAERRRRR
jgi:hypothetical protein